MIKVCESLPDGENRAVCLGLVNRDPEACGALDSQDGRDGCYARMGDYLQDATVCEKIAGGALHDGCVDVVGFETGRQDVCAKCRNRFDNIKCMALAGKDAALCEQLLKPDMRAVCTAYASGSPTMCDTVQDKSVKDDCLIVFAIQKRDKNLCEKMESLDTKALCLMVVGKDNAACGGMPTEEHRIRCSAVVEDDPAVCDGLKDTQSRSNCVRNYVEVKLNYYD
ncbi:MAG: hypothetical protein V1875_04285 [Candidatus Altiarchaeota archaeon]